MFNFNFITLTTFLFKILSKVAPDRASLASVKKFLIQLQDGDDIFSDKFNQAVDEYFAPPKDEKYFSKLTLSHIVYRAMKASNPDGKYTMPDILNYVNKIYDGQDVLSASKESFK